jgi:D-alanyl-lipoteichoic acid acyltransferase DltB (MBOAT superfamily)
MVFNSLVFAVFFVIVFSSYWLLRHSLRLQNLLLFVASSFFYGWWDWRFLFLMYFTIVLDFLVGWGLERQTDDRKRKRLLILSVTANLTVLGFFKYFNFFIESATQLLDMLGMHPHPIVLRIVLPVGVSFYTFQSISFVVDVYKRELKPPRSLLYYATYVSLFPQLVAGPIERAKHLLPQVLKPRTITWEKIFEGSYLILWGLFKKVFIADNLAKIVDPIFATGHVASGAEVIVAVYAFAFQIYADFSGYTDIARGTAKFLGFDLMLNFNLPYFATNPSDFWRRWHISLSTWLRDYLYKSLGGNRRGNARTYVNLMITMLLGGLWHGARWNFVLWGAYQGALLAIHRAATPALERLGLRVPERLLRPISMIIFFQFVCFGWLLFRADSFGQIAHFTAAIFAGVDYSVIAGYLPKLLVYICPLLAVQVLQYNSGNLNVVLSAPVAVRAAFYVLIFFAIMGLGNLGASQFIYFQF